MAQPKKTTKANADGLDDLLSLDGDTAPETKAESMDDLVKTPEESAPAPDLTPVAEDDADAEIAALKAALAAPMAQPKDVRPVPESQLSPKERELRDLRDKMAQRRALEAEQAAPTYDDATGADVILIHVLEDGFTINGEVCYRGREIEFVKGGRAYEQTKNRFGVTWLDMTEEEQYKRWGKQNFGLGKWPFRPLSQLTLKDLPEGSTAEDLASVKRAAAKNDRRAPVINF